MDGALFDQCTMLRDKVSRIQRMATHLVILASLASTLLALFLDRKVSAPPAMASRQAGALTRLEHNHSDNSQTTQDLEDSKNHIQHCFRSFQGPVGHRFQKLSRRTRKYRKVYHNFSRIASLFRDFLPTRA